MTTRLLLAKRINNGQSEIWLDAELEKRIVVATNGILHPARINSAIEELISRSRQDQQSYHIRLHQS